MHELCHGVALCRSVAARVAVLHVVPVEGRGRQVGKLDSFGGTGVARDDLRGGLRPLVEVHHLRHGGGHAARGTAAGARPCAVGGAKVVVGRVLVPRRCAEGRDGRGAVGAYFAPRGLGCGALRLLLLQPGYFVGIALQPGFHVVGNVVRVDASALAEAEDGPHAVVARDDDEAAVVLHVEEKESAHLALERELRPDALCLAGAAGVGLAGLQEVDGQLEGLRFRHFLCLDARCAEQGHDEQRDRLRKEGSYVHLCM